VVALTLVVASCVGLGRLPRREGSRPWAAAAVAALVGAVFPRLLPDTLAGIRVDVAATASTYAILFPMMVLGARRLRLAVATPFGGAIAVTVVLAIMTLGPVVATADGGVPTPAILVCRLPGLSAIRLSARWGIVMNLAAAGAAAAALAGIEGRARRFAATALLGAFRRVRQHRSTEPLRRDVPGAARASARRTPGGHDSSRPPAAGGRHGTPLALRS
jgi:hypothetical protein